MLVFEEVSLQLRGEFHPSGGSIKSQSPLDQKKCSGTQNDSCLHLHLVSPAHPATKVSFFTALIEDSKIAFISN
jgi:hypothetical protein